VTGNSKEKHATHRGLTTAVRLTRLGNIARHKSHSPGATAENPMIDNADRGNVAEQHGRALRAEIMQPR